MLGNGARFLSSLAAVSLAAAPAAAIKVHLELVPARASAVTEPVVAELLLAPPVADEKSPAREPLRLRGEVPGKVTVDLAPGSWRLSAAADGLWVAERTLEPSFEAQTVILRFHETASVRGRLRVPRGEKAPDDVVARISAALERPAREESVAVEKSRVDCELEADVFRCVLPAMALDLEIWPREFIPHYRWALEPEPGQALDLGDLELEKGASVTGWVATRDGEDLPESVQVHLLPAGLHAARPSSDAASRLVSRSAAPRANGFFQLLDVPRGEHALTARADGYAPAVVKVSILENTEARLRQPLVLAPPVELAVIVEPPLDPQGAPWRLQIGRLDPYRNGLTGVREVEVPANGVFEEAGFSPGPYRLSLESSTGDKLASREVEVGEEPSPIVLQPDVVLVAGSVLLGREPVPEATIWFGGRYGATRVTATSDEEGHYQAALPRAGKWKVEIAADEPAISRSFPVVEVPEPGGGVSELDLELPDTLLRGRVVQEDGTPVDRSIVTVSSRVEEGLARVQQVVGEGGEFEFHGLAEGPVSLGAQAREGQSDWLDVELVEHYPAPEQELVVRSRLEVTGRVVADGRPVAGALLTMDSMSDLYTGSPWSTTGPDGLFTASLPGETRQAMVTYGAPGFALRAARLPVEGERLPDLELSRQGGTLWLALPEDAYEAGRGTSPILYQDGLLLHRAWLNKWTASQPSTTAAPLEPGWRRIPQLAPGHYVLCRAAPTEVVGWALAQYDPKRCNEGNLAPNGELTLEWPAED